MPHETTAEAKGDIILGTALVNCHHDTRYDKAQNLKLVSSPLLLGSGGLDHWTKHETRPGGWERHVTMVLDTSANDPSRATARFQVMSVMGVQAETGRDAGYGGGTQIIVKRLDGKPERILYTREHGHQGPCDGGGESVAL